MGEREKLEQLKVSFFAEEDKYREQIKNLSLENLEADIVGFRLLKLRSEINDSQAKFFISVNELRMAWIKSNRPQS